MIRSLKKVTAVVTSVIIFFTLALTVSGDTSYKNWLQSDSRWGSKCLGVSNETMSQVGCAVTSVAILAVHSGSISESSFNPGILCDYLSKNNGFDSYANLYWGAVSGLVPGFTFQKRANLSSSTKTGITNELAEYINQGYYIILSVNNDSHWIAIDTIKNGEVYMMDPAQNSKTKLFDRYNADTMPQVRLYKGKNIPAKVTASSASNTYLTGHYKTTSALNLRSSYNTSSSILKTIPVNSNIVVTRVYNNEWGQVEYDNKIGWIYLEYTKYTEGSYTYKTGKHKVNVKSGVYLRSGIGTQNNSVCLVPYNEVVNIFGVSANWGRTSYNGKVGWICMEYVTYSGTASVTTVTKTTTPATTKATTVKTTQPTTTTKKITTKITTTTKIATTTKTTTTEITTTTKSTIPLIKGDVSRDGRLSKNDLILLNNYIAKPVYKKYEIRYVMDVNNDGKIDERDSVCLMFKIINKGK